ncbi:phage/plasmid primase, P4 family [Prolixibacteraceae bacterium Z1-6]|uniref:Phage/plasmid primase, P4 family n=1 Tax=Draconibacterium aestuarii TaxID=2998507 RepID=A0A9X3F7X9_9BACT|nr:phage/plasmid primase, P4 family [Prolixibacteraceae bacterium Z1-6]
MKIHIKEFDLLDLTNTMQLVLPPHEEGSSKELCRGGQTQSEVLDRLLKEIQPINVREYLKLPDDVDICQKHIIVATIKNQLQVASEKKWNLAKVYDYVYVFNGEFWQQLDKEDLKSFLGRAAVNMGFPDYDVRHYEFKDKLLRQFLSDAYLPAPPNQPDQVLINLENGTMEFSASGWKLRPFNPVDFMTYQLPFSYDPNAECPMFDKYLEEVQPDESSRKVLQEFAGYIFTNLNLEKMLMLVGSGANGKSVFFNIISAIVGKQNILNYSLGMFGHEYNRAKLTNVLLNYSSEKGTELNPDTLKALVSGEPLQTREPYGKPFTLTNKVRFIINANELPRETEQTKAYFRRYLIVPFDVTITEDQRDIDLADKIIENELSGVFNWLLKGLERILEQRQFTRSEKSEEALEDFRRKSDSVALFVEEFSLEQHKTEKTELVTIYKKYKEFCHDDGYKPLGKNNFSTRLEKKGFVKTRMNNGSTAFFIKSDVIISVGGVSF